MPTPIETAFADLCAKHDLTSVSVDFNLKQALESRFGCFVHYEGFTKRGHGCSSGHGATPQRAIGNALSEAREDRIPHIDVPGLTIAEAA